MSLLRSTWTPQARCLINFKVSHISGVTSAQVISWMNHRGLQAKPASVWQGITSYSGLTPQVKSPSESTSLLQDGSETGPMLATGCLSSHAVPPLPPCQKSRESQRPISWLDAKNAQQDVTLSSDLAPCPTADPRGMTRVISKPAIRSEA